MSTATVDINGLGDRVSEYVDWSPFLTTQPVGIRNEHSSTFPITFNLQQNYPNPFNPTTTIEFNIPKSSRVKLILYDIVGREVARLVNEQLNAGSYQVKWDAAVVPSGIYLYQIQAEQFTETKKMILLR